MLTIYTMTHLGIAVSFPEFSKKAERFFALGKGQKMN